MIPQLDILSKVAPAIAMVTSVEPSVKYPHIYIESAVAETPDEAVNPETGPDSDNVDTLLWHEP